jgi:hypothetical protein
MAVEEGSPEMKKITASFPFENKGQVPVTITSIKTNCGCTAASTARKTWQPGERGEVTVSLTIGNRRGLYQTPVTVTTDDQASPVTVLEFRPLIHDVMDILPTFVFWRPGEPPAEKLVKIRVTTPQPLDDLQAVSSSPGIVARLEAVKAGRDYVLHVAPGPGVESARASIKLTASQAGHEPREFTVRARVR